MSPLATTLACLLAVPASAQVVGEAASAASGSSSAGAAVTSIPGGVSLPALSPSLAPGLQGSLLSAPSAAPAPGAPLPALGASAIIPIDPAAMKSKGRDHTPEEWGKLVAASKDEGTKAVLRSMPGDNPADPELTVKLKGGEELHGSFRGLADGKMIFSAGGKLVGLKMDAGNIEEVRRRVDVMFDGANLRPDEVVVHARPPVADPFKDLARYKGRVLDIDTRDLEDLKWSAQTVSGRLVKADGEELVLEGPKGKYHITREFHRVDKAALRVEHYSSKDQISTIAAVEGKIPDGGPVEVVLDGGKTISGRFFGVRKDAEGPYVLLEVPAAGGTRFRAFRDFRELRTPGYAKGALLDGSELVYAAPDK
jgi:hypothetical protein